MITFPDSVPTNTDSIEPFLLFCASSEGAPTTRQFAGEFNVRIQALLNVGNTVRLFFDRCGEDGGECVLDFGSLF
jgi:hypothetical protein